MEWCHEDICMKESVLRDLIAKDICKLRQGLTLLQKEQFIPNIHGARGFIDLYAKDERILYLER